MSFQILVNTSFGGEAGGDCFKHFVCFEVYLVQPSVQFALGEQSGVPSATVLFDVIKVHPSILADLIVGLFGKGCVGNKVSVFFVISPTKVFIQCFHYSISIQINICDILYRLSLPLFFETFVMGHQEKSAHRKTQTPIVAKQIP